MSTTSSQTEATALKLLRVRERTEAELRAALEKKALPPDDIAQVLRQLTTRRYLDDARVARRMAEEHLARQEAPQRVIARLLKRGIEQSLAEQIVEQLMHEHGTDSVAQARHLLAKLKKQGLAAARALANRGFDEETIRAVLPSIEDNGSTD